MTDEDRKRVEFYYVIQYRLFVAGLKIGKLCQTH